MVVQIIKDKVLWDTFVDESPYGLLFHKWDFLEIVAKHTKLTLYRYGIYKGDELIAVFPFFYGKKLFLRTLFSPPPNFAIPYLGFILNDKFLSLKQDKKESFMAEVVNSINEINIKYPSDYLYISLVPDLIDVREFSWSGYKITPYYTYSIQLPENIDDLFINFKKNARKIIKNIPKEQLSLLQSDDLSILFAQQNQRYNEQGINNPIQNIEYLLNIKNKFPENVFYYKLFFNNILLSSILMIEYKKAMAWIGHSKPEDNSNDIFMWELIKNERNKGYNKFEIIGANTKKLCQFKSKFNPTLEFYFVIYQKDILGKIAEGGYSYFIKRKWF